MTVSREDADAIARRLGFGTVAALVNAEKRKVILDAHAREEHERAQWVVDEKAQRISRELARIREAYAISGVVGGSWKGATWRLVLADRMRRDTGLVKIEGAASRIGPAAIAFWRSQADKQAWVAKKTANDSFLAGQRLRGVSDSQSLSHLPNSPLELRFGADSCVSFDVETLQSWYDLVDRARSRLEDSLGALALSTIKPQLREVWDDYIGLQIALEISFKKEA